MSANWRQGPGLVQVCRTVPLITRFHVETFRFVKHPEFLKEGQRLVFREGRTKAVGNVSKIIPYIPATVAKDQKSKSHQVCRLNYENLQNFLIKTFPSSGPGRRKEKNDRSEQSDGSDTTTTGPGSSLTRLLQSLRSVLIVNSLSLFTL